MYSSSIILPDYLLKCQSVIRSIYDEKNFLYCVIRHLWPVTAKITHFKDFPRKYEQKFNLEGLTFPLDFKRIKTFVRKNRHLPLTIRVFFESEAKLCVLDTFSNVRDKRKRYKKVLNLLMMKSDPELSSCGTEKEDGFSSTISTIKNLNHQHHFFTIKNIRAFLNKRRHHLSLTAVRQNYYYCRICLMNFRSNKKQKAHHEVCQRDKQEVLYVQKGSVLKFSKQRNQFKAPVIGFADFECYMEENTDNNAGQQVCRRCEKLTSKCHCDKSSNQVLSNHKACGFSICFVDSDNVVFHQETYGGTDAVKVFLDRMPYYEEIVNQRKQRFRSTAEIKATEEDWHRYHAATRCHICDSPFGDQNSHLYRKVIDHDHVSGGNIQAAHSICNLQRQGPYLTPIYFHNGQG